MGYISAGMLTENSNPLYEPMKIPGGILPGDTIRVTKEFKVMEVGYNAATDTAWYGTSDGFKYGNKNWNIEKITNPGGMSLKDLIMNNTPMEASMTNYNVKPTANEKLTEVTRYQDLKAGDVIRVTREAVVSQSSTWEGITTKDGRKIRIAAAESADLKRSGFKVEKVTKLSPDFWPPVIGDKWKATTGEEYAVQKASFGSNGHLVRPDDPYTYSNLSIDELKNKTPKLVYRKGVKLP
jgi:hypothetical protein